MCYEEKDGIDIYKITGLQENICSESHIPLRKQIIDFANCKLAEMLMDITGIEDISDPRLCEALVSVKTDCLTLRKEYVNGCTLGYRKCNIPDVQKFITWKQLCRTDHGRHPDKQWNTHLYFDWLNTPPQPCCGEEACQGQAEPETTPLQRMLEELDKMESARINGEAGHGKSVLLMKQAEYFMNQGLKVLVCSFTNVAAMRIGGTTIHNGLCISTQDFITRKTLPDIILIDESSQVPAELWEKMALIKKLGCRIYHYGDDWQTMPVEEHTEVQCTDYLNSSAIMELSNFHWVKLMTNYRIAKDPSNLLHELIKELKQTGKISDEAKAISELMHIKTNICWSQRMRKHINHLHMQAITTHKGTFKIYKVQGDIYTQDGKLCKGLPVIIRHKDKQIGLIKGAHYQVAKWDKKTLTIERPIKKDGVQQWEQNTIPMEKFYSYLLPAYCLTTHSIRGDTFDHPFVIHEFERMKCVKWRYTAISRGTHHKHLNICEPIVLPSIETDPAKMKQLRQYITSFVRGCTFEEFWDYMNEKLKVMQGGLTWSDHGHDWEIDHIIPKDLWNSRQAGGVLVAEQLRKPEEKDIMNHYTNLQPLDPSKNRSKKNKYFDCQRNVIF